MLVYNCQYVANLLLLQTSTLYIPFVCLYPGDLFHTWIQELSLQIVSPLGNELPPNALHIFSPHSSHNRKSIYRHGLPKEDRDLDDPSDYLRHELLHDLNNLTLKDRIKALWLAYSLAITALKACECLFIAHNWLELSAPQFTSSRLGYKAWDMIHLQPYSFRQGTILP